MSSARQRRPRRASRPPGGRRPRGARPPGSSPPRRSSRRCRSTRRWSASGCSRSGRGSVRRRRAAGLRPPEHRSGVGRGRGLRRAARQRLHHRHPPRPRPHHRQGRVVRADDRRADGSLDGLLPRQGRVDAHRRLSLGVLGANGILGAGQPIAVGAAYSARAQGRDDVAVSFFGEGASAQGAVSEAMNLAARSGRRRSCSSPRSTAAAELTPYDVHVSVPVAGRARRGVRDPGADGRRPRRPRRPRQYVATLLEAVRAGGGPALLELRTIRHRGHFEGDQQRYRDPGELERLGEGDPIAALETRLAASGVDAERAERPARGRRGGAGVRRGGRARRAAARARAPARGHLRDQRAHARAGGDLTWPN